MNLFELTTELMRIPSISGDEQKVGAVLGEYLESLGYHVELQEVIDGRRNVIAWPSDSPEVFLSTHMYTVPPFIPPTEDNEKIYGRVCATRKRLLPPRLSRRGILESQTLFFTP